jgi:hypothetical protein
MTWAVRVRDVRRRAGGLRWTLLASTPDLETLVYVDTTDRGGVLAMQSDEYLHGTGDDELDYLAGVCVRQALATRNSCQLLDGIDRRRWGRIQQPADRRWSI